MIPSAGPDLRPRPRARVLQDVSYAHVSSIAVRFVYGFLVLVAVLRVLLLFLRPRTSRRFADPRRQRIANWVDRLGDLLFLVTAYWVVRYGEGASWKMALLWVAGLCASLFIVGSAHNVARRAGRGRPAVAPHPGTQPLPRPRPQG